MTELEGRGLRLLRRIERRLRDQAAWSRQDQRLHGNINALIYELEQAARARVQAQPTLKPIPQPAPQPPAPPTAEPKTARRYSPERHAEMLPIWRANAAKARAARAAKREPEGETKRTTPQLAKNIIIRTVHVPVPVPVPAAAAPTPVSPADDSDQPSVDPRAMGKLYWSGQGSVVDKRERQRHRMHSTAANSTTTMGEALRDAADRQLRNGLTELRNGMRTRHWVKLGLGEDGRPVCSTITAAEAPQVETGFALHGPYLTPAEAHSRSKQLLHDAFRYS